MRNPQSLKKNRHGIRRRNNQRIRNRPGMSHLNQLINQHVLPHLYPSVRQNRLLLLRSATPAHYDLPCLQRLIALKWTR
ncbi:hypothetical protein ANCCAN_17285 [Ancylostoma caninum]|uniref:Uncharacterized protein n=1 Tax=Ancylostoma caninum TaxID=29170 RepID=A0A368FXA5_ANCCA|nr:hypothetical protein ANCCAN_17285 [Ancylostoma caninum]